MTQHGIRLFIAVNIALLALLAWLWIGPDGKPRNVVWQPPQPVAPELGSEAAALPEAKPMDTGLFVATLDRPLFSPSRRPVPPAPKEAQTKTAPDPLANVHLYGIYSTEGGPGGMLARIDGKVRRVALNENLGGWTLKSVQEREATLTRDGEERVIQLAIVRPSAPGKAAAGGQQPAATAAATPPAPPPSGGSAVGTTEERRQQLEESRRELQRRRNELRAKAGARPVP